MPAVKRPFAAVSEEDRIELGRRVKKLKSDCATSQERLERPDVRALMRSAEALDKISDTFENATALDRKAQNILDDYRWIVQSCFDASRFLIANRDALSAFLRAQELCTGQLAVVERDVARFIASHPNIEVVFPWHDEREIVRKVAFYRTSSGGEPVEVTKLKQCRRPAIVVDDEDQHELL